MFARALRTVSLARAIPPERWLIGGFIAAAMLSGAVIATENLMLMALIAGALLSAVLLSAPAIALWIVLIGTLVVAGPLVFNLPALHRLPWVFSVLGLFLLAAAFLYGGLSQARERGPVPAFIVAAIAFLAYALASTLWGDAAPLGEEAAAARRIFQYWGVMFAIALIAFPDQTVRRWVLFIVILALCQFPVTLYQRIVIQPTLFYTETLDAIVGTFEVPFTGGGASSGVLAYMQIVMVAALAAAYRERLISTVGLVLGQIAVFIPLAVGEVNIMFIWLPLALAAVFLDQIRRRPALFLGWALTISLGLGTFGSLYLVIQQSHGGPIMTPQQKLQEIYDYNLGGLGYGNATNLNRASVLPYWVKHHGFNDPVATTFGHGLGSSFSGGETRTTLRLVHADRSIDLLALTGMLWDFGLVGAGLYLAMLILAWRSAYRLTRIARPGFDRALARSLFASSTLLLSLAFYSNALSTTATQQVLAMLSFGVLAWMERRYAYLASDPSRAATYGLDPAPALRQAD